MKIAPILHTIAQRLSEHNAKMILVGGCVRDHLLGREPKDYDIEVYGLSSLEELEAILEPFGRVMQVGKSFGVVKLVVEGREYDFAFPRLEKKVGSGHRGFVVQIDGALDFKEAAKRRDFTVNAMGYDISQKRILDPWGGREDLDRGVLRHIDEKSFVEDPLRLYRGVQFCARFDLRMSEETIALCQQMVDRGDLETLPKERIFDELKKLLLQAPKPSVGFELLRQTGALRYFPELEALIGVEQDPIWHPEGDVWTHTMMVIDAMAKIKRGSEKEQLILSFAALCHDLGKATTTEFIDGRIRSRGHERAGVEPTRRFLERLSEDRELIEGVLPLVDNHLAPFTLYEAGSSDKAIRRLSTRVNIERLLLVAEVDFLGRTSEDAKSGHSEALAWLAQKAEELKVKDSAPKPILMGRDLIDLGLKPSPKFKEILDLAYQKQLDGEIASKAEAIAFAKMETTRSQA